MRCPDCSSPTMRKRGNFYTCERCGLSVKPWEIQNAIERAKREIHDLEGKDLDVAAERKKRERKRYRNWYEGRQNIDQ